MATDALGLLFCSIQGYLCHKLSSIQKFLRMIDAIHSSFKTFM